MKTMVVQHQRQRFCIVLLSLIVVVSIYCMDQSNLKLLMNNKGLLLSVDRKMVEDNPLNDDDDEEDDDDDGSESIETGILSQKDHSFFLTIQNEIDYDYDPYQRCQRYNYTYHPNSQQRPLRRIFYGSLIADETMELLNIVATETYQIYTGMVLVESNRTQSFRPRSWKYHHHYHDSSPYHQNQQQQRRDDSMPKYSQRQQERIASLFGISNLKNVLILPYINEDPQLRNLDREHRQRELIITGWKQLGMQPNDIGLLADIDETFTRDYLRALQTCDNIPQLNYNTHHCHHDSVKIVATTRIYQSSPECITQDRKWFHPDIIVGHCIDGVGNVHSNPKALRANNGTSYMREVGYGKDCQDWYNESKITNNRYPLWNAADFRRTCGGKQVHVQPRTMTESIFRSKNSMTNAMDNTTTTLRTSVPSTLSATATLGLHTGYHFHNFFATMNATRFKYLSYGHPDPYAYNKPLQNVSDALEMMVHCVMQQHDVKNKSNNEQQLQRSKSTKWQHVKGGHNGTKYFVPIYFQDANYRSRRHEHVYNMIQTDQQQQQKTLIQS